jgi:hypothetical protein
MPTGLVLSMQDSKFGPGLKKGVGTSNGFSGRSAIPLGNCYAGIDAGDGFMGLDHGLTRAVPCKG